jgi:pyridoxamine 5'-phosphate oxidase
MFSFDIDDIRNLTDAEKLCWQMLLEGLRDRFSPMHQVVVGTVREGCPMTRVVVLRRVDPDTRKLYFHTDMRKELVKDIQTSGVLSWLAYDKQLRSQIRLFGRTEVHHKDELAARQWQATPHFSRRCYLQEDAPGALSDGSYHAKDLGGFDYTPGESEMGYDHFAVVETSVEWMDWYFTHNRGNRRARFDYNEGVLSNSQWLFP